MNGPAPISARSLSPFRWLGRWPLYFGGRRLRAHRLCVRLRAWLGDWRHVRKFAFDARARRATRPARRTRWRTWSVRLMLLCTMLSALGIVRLGRLDPMATLEERLTGGIRLKSLCGWTGIDFDSRNLRLMMEFDKRNAERFLLARLAKEHGPGFTSPTAT